MPGRRFRSVGLRPYGLRYAGPITPETSCWGRGGAELLIRQHPNGGLGLLLDFGLALERPTEAAVHEASLLRHLVDELGLRGAPQRRGFAALLCRVEQISLHLVHCCDQPRGDSLERHRFLLSPDAPGQHDRTRRHIARTDLQPKRDAPPLPLVILGARLHPFARIQMNSDPANCELFPETVRGFQYEGALLGALVDGHDHYLVLR